MSRADRGPLSRVPDVRRPITIRLPNETLAELQFVSASIRRSTGAALGSSAIVRGLISWLAETDVDTKVIQTPEELRAQLLASVRGGSEAVAGGDSRVSHHDHSPSQVQDGRRDGAAAPPNPGKGPDARRSPSPRG